MSRRYPVTVVSAGFRAWFDYTLTADDCGLSRARILRAVYGTAEDGATVHHYDMGKTAYRVLVNAPTDVQATRIARACVDVVRAHGGRIVGGG